MENFLLPNMIELFETNRMSHFPPFYDDYLKQKFNFKDWIFHSGIICGPELCRRYWMMKTRLEANICGYPLRLALLFTLAYSDGAHLILSCSNSNEEPGPCFSVFSVFRAKGRFRGKNCKNCLSSVAHKT